MKYIFAFLLLIVLGISVSQISTICKETATKLKKTIVRINICMACIGIFYIGQILIVNEKIAYVMSGLYKHGGVIISFFFFSFVTEVTQSKQIPSTIKWGYLVGAGIDLVYLMANAFTQSVFRLKLTMDDTGLSFYSIGEYNNGYVFHAILQHSVVLYCLWLLLKKTCSIAGMYRMKYLVYIYMAAIVGIVDTIGLKLKANLDYSLLFFAFTSLTIYYFCFTYVPRGLLNRFMSVIIKENDDGVVFFDMFGNCQYENAKAKEFFSIWDINSQSEKLFSDWLSGENMQDILESEWESQFEKEDETYYFLVKFRQLYDQKKKYLGCFFIIQNETEKTIREREDFYSATRDKLTGIYNREYFYEQATKQIAMNSEDDYCVLCCDIMDFKMINDMFGVEKGDEILLKLTDEIIKIAREGIIYGRIGSDRFAICMKQSEFDREKLIQYMNHTEYMMVVDSFQAKIYVGVYENIGKDVPIAVVCDRTILAINTIKGDMRTNVAFYDETFRKKMLSEQQLTSDFNQSMRERKFHIYLQPHFSQEGKLFGAEALVRWFHPIRGMILPQEFLPVFERTGLISRLDVYVWELACKQLRRWKELGLDEYYISVNISERDMYYIDIYETLTNMVEQHDIDVKNLRLEITESVVVQDVEKVIALLNRLHEYGFYIYMDNFGSGYSSLNMLKDLPLDTIKIDMEFVKKSAQIERNKQILDMIVRLSHRIGLKVITQGIETEEQLEFIHKTGCTQFQGFCFSRPLPVKAFEEKYLR
ncbi:MAG: phosphodiesterase [Lachnospiraceae bacterium]|nr:phosphodiesterase [Lachnospiraceae bacterium]